MPCIRTKEWLLDAIELLDYEQLDENELCDIVNGNSLGSISFWQNLFNKLQNYSMIYADESIDTINRISSDIRVYGKNVKCTIYYYVEQRVIHFVDYCLNHNENSDMMDLHHIEVTLSEAYEYFSYQNYILINYY